MTLHNISRYIRHQNCIILQIANINSHNTLHCEYLFFDVFRHFISIYACALKIYLSYQLPVCSLSSNTPYTATIATCTCGGVMWSLLCCTVFSLMISSQQVLACLAVPRAFRQKYRLIAAGDNATQWGDHLITREKGNKVLS